MKCHHLLHGLARSERSMQKLEKALLKQGYFVRNVSYESTRNNVAKPPAAWRGNTAKR